MVQMRATSNIGVDESESRRFVSKFASIIELAFNYGGNSLMLAESRVDDKAPRNRRSALLQECSCSFATDRHASFS